MAIWFGVLVLIFLIPLLCMNNRCKKVDKLGSDVYGVIVNAGRSYYRYRFNDNKRVGFNYIYGFDIAVFYGKKRKRTEND